jgi:hypothetical protein
LQEFLAKVKPKQKKVFSELRTAIIALPETQESIEIDELSGDWCPAYRVRGADLVWVHLVDRLWVHVPIEPDFEKKLLQDENLDSAVVEQVKEAEETGGLKLAKFEVKSTNEIEQIMPLLKLRHSSLTK